MTGNGVMKSARIQMGNAQCPSMSMASQRISAKEIDIRCRNIEIKEGSYLSAQNTINVHGFQSFSCRNSKIEAATINFPINSNPDLGNCNIVGTVSYIDFTEIENKQGAYALEEAKKRALENLERDGDWLESFMFSYSREKLSEQALKGVKKFFDSYPGTMGEKIRVIKNLDEGSDAQFLLSVFSILRAINNLPDIIKDVGQSIDLKNRENVFCVCNDQTDYGVGDYFVSLKNSDENVFCVYDDQTDYAGGYFVSPVEACKSFSSLKNSAICKEFNELNQELIHLNGDALQYCGFGSDMSCYLKSSDAYTGAVDA